MAGEQNYLAFLVRLWTVHAHGGLVWRASADNVHSGEHRAFADLASLYEFLRAAAAQPEGHQATQCQDAGDAGSDIPPTQT